MTKDVKGMQLLGILSFASEFLELEGYWENLAISEFVVVVVWADSCVKLIPMFPKTSDV